VKRFFSFSFGSVTEDDESGLGDVSPPTPTESEPSQIFSQGKWPSCVPFRSFFREYFIVDFAEVDRGVFRALGKLQTRVMAGTGQ
jgi:hypothetical protein